MHATRTQTRQQLHQVRLPFLVSTLHNAYTNKKRELRSRRRREALRCSYLSSEVLQITLRVVWLPINGLILQIGPTQNYPSGENLAVSEAEEDF